MKSITFALGLVLLLAACATPPAPQPVAELLANRGLQKGESVDRIANYRINGWNYLNPTHFIFDAGPSRSYLVELRVPCHDLRSTEVLAFTTTARDVTKFDSVKVRNAGMRRDCPIAGLYTLDKIK